MKNSPQIRQLTWLLVTVEGAEEPGVLGSLRLRLRPPLLLGEMTRLELEGEGLVASDLKRLTEFRRSSGMPSPTA